METLEGQRYNKYKWTFRKHIRKQPNVSMHDLGRTVPTLLSMTGFVQQNNLWQHYWSWSETVVTRLNICSWPFVLILWMWGTLEHPEVLKAHCQCLMLDLCIHHQNLALGPTEGLSTSEAKYQRSVSDPQLSGGFTVCASIFFSCHFNNTFTSSLTWWKPVAHCRTGDSWVMPSVCLPSLS